MIHQKSTRLACYMLTAVCVLWFAQRDWGQLLTQYLMALLRFMVPYMHQEGMRNVLIVHIMTLSVNRRAGSQAELFLVFGRTRKGSWLCLALWFWDRTWTNNLRWRPGSVWLNFPRGQRGEDHGFLISLTLWGQERGGVAFESCHLWNVKTYQWIFHIQFDLYSLNLHFEWVFYSCMVWNIIYWVLEKFF